MFTTRSARSWLVQSACAEWQVANGSTNHSAVGLNGQVIIKTNQHDPTKKLKHSPETFTKAGERLLEREIRWETSRILFLIMYIVDLKKTAMLARWF